METRGPQAWLLACLSGIGLFLLAALLLALRPGLLDAADAHLQGAGGAAGLALATALAWAGNVEIHLPLVALGLLLLHHKGRTHAALVLACAFLAQELLVEGLKAWIARPRPEAGLATAAGWSFPSGHAARGALLACLLVHLASDASSPRPRRALVTLAVAWALAMAASRVVLGAHHASDVLAGAGIGLALGGLAAALACALDPPRRAVRVPVATPASVTHAHASPGDGSAGPAPRRREHAKPRTRGGPP